MDDAIGDLIAEGRKHEAAMEVLRPQCLCASPIAIFGVGHDDECPAAPVDAGYRACDEWMHANLVRLLDALESSRWAHQADLRQAQGLLAEQTEMLAVLTDAAKLGRSGAAEAVREHDALISEVERLRAELRAVRSKILDVDMPDGRDISLAAHIEQLLEDR